jgi:hypothetical protein
MLRQRRYIGIWSKNQTDRVTYLRWMAAPSICSFGESDRVRFSRHLGRGLLNVTGVIARIGRYLDRQSDRHDRSTLEIAECVGPKCRLKRAPRKNIDSRNGNSAAKIYSGLFATSQALQDAFSKTPWRVDSSTPVDPSHLLSKRQSC